MRRPLRRHSQASAASLGSVSLGQHPPALPLIPLRPMPPPAVSAATATILIRTKDFWLALPGRLLPAPVSTSWASHLAPAMALSLPEPLRTFRRPRHFLPTTLSTLVRLARFTAALVSLISP